MQLDSTLSATAQPFQPQATPQSSQEDDVPNHTLFNTDWQGVVLLQVLLLTHMWEGHFLATTNPLMMIGYPWIRPSPISPPEGGMGAEEAEVAGVVVTPMGPAPLGGDIRKRMDFQVKSRSPNSEARRALLMMWPVPLGSGPTVSPTIMITTKILTSCPW